MIKPVANYEGRYLISFCGEVISIISDRRILKPKINKYGYPVVNLTDGCGNTKTACIHRLVAEAFCHKEEANYVVNHKDLNKKNNAYTNLEWCSTKDNFEHAVKHNVIRAKVGTLKYAKEIDNKIFCLRKEGMSIYKIAALLGISKSTVYRRTLKLGD